MKTFVTITRTADNQYQCVQQGLNLGGEWKMSPLPAFTITELEGWLSDNGIDASSMQKVRALEIGESTQVTLDL